MSSKEPRGLGFIQETVRKGEEKGEGVMQRREEGGNETRVEKFKCTCTERYARTLQGLTALRISESLRTGTRELRLTI